MEDKLSILVVEDDDLIRECVCDTLADADFLVLAAPSATEAFNLLDAPGPIDAAFVDVDLRDWADGWMVARHARERRPGITVIYTSGGGQPRFEMERVEPCVFIPKPYLPSRVCGLISRMLRETRH
jgi:DNA-binding NtrC family response regulator